LAIVGVELERVGVERNVVGCCGYVDSSCDE
jgi:hypothetical protein